MALQVLPTTLLLPSTPLGGAPAYASSVANAPGEGIGFICMAPRDLVIRKIGFRTATVTTGGDLDCRVETVVNGLPSGTLWAADTNIVHTVGVADDDAWFWTANLTADASIPKGSLFAVVLKNVTGNYNLVNAISNGVPGLGLPYAVLNTGAWAKNANRPSLGVQLSDGSKPYLELFPVTADGAGSVSLPAVVFNSGSTPDEIGVRFSLPFKCKVIGGGFKVATAATTCALKLYDTDGSTVLASRTGIDLNATALTGALVTVPFASEATLGANNVYRLTVLPESATDITIYNSLYEANSDLAMVEMGASWYKTARTDGGAWTDTDTQRPFFGLLLSALDDGAGGGSPIYQFRKKGHLYVPDPLLSV